MKACETNFSGLVENANAPNRKGMVFEANILIAEKARKHSFDTFPFPYWTRSRVLQRRLSLFG